MTPPDATHKGRQVVVVVVVVVVRGRLEGVACGVAGLNCPTVQLQGQADHGQPPWTPPWCLHAEDARACVSGEGRESVYMEAVCAVCAVQCSALLSMCLIACLFTSWHDLEGVSVCVAN